MKILYVLLTLDMLQMAVYLPIFGPYIRSLGGTSSTLGFINSFTALITFFWNPVVGSLSDQNGRRSLLLQCSLATAIGSLILSTAQSSLVLIYVGKLIGAFGTPTNSLLRTVVADVYEKNEDKKRFFDKCGPVLSVTFLLGSFTGGFLTEFNNGYTVAFLLMATISTIATGIVYTYLPKDDKPIKKQAKTSESSVVLNKLSEAVKDLKTITWSRYWDAFVIRGLFDFSVMMLLSNLGFFLSDEFNVKGRSVGYIFVSISLCGIVASVLKLKLANRLAKISDYNKILCFGSVILLCYLAISTSTSVYPLVIFVDLFILAKNFMDTSLQEVILTKANDNDRGRVFSAYDNLLPLASILAPALSGIFSKKIGERLFLASASIPVAISLAVAYTYKDKKE